VTGGSVGVCAWINAYAPITATVTAANIRPMRGNRYVPLTFSSRV
jgi:hypothetical protein